MPATPLRYLMTNRSVRAKTKLMQACPMPRAKRKPHRLKLLYSRRSCDKVNYLLSRPRQMPREEYGRQKTKSLPLRQNYQDRKRLTNSLHLIGTHTYVLPKQGQFLNVEGLRQHHRRNNKPQQWRLQDVE